MASDRNAQEAVEKILSEMHAGVRMRNMRSGHQVVLGGRSGADCARFFTQETGLERPLRVHFHVAVNEISERDADLIVPVAGSPGKVRIRNNDRFFQLIANEYDMISLRIGQYSDFIEGNRAQTALSNSYDSSAVEHKISSLRELSRYRNNTNFSIRHEEGKGLTLTKNDQSWLTISTEPRLTVQINWWPDSLREWRERERVWPPKDVVERLCQKCYLTRQNNNNNNGFQGDDNRFQFHYSFYNIERELMNRMTTRQRTIYFKFKALIYKHVDPVDPDNIPDALGHTIMLFALEFRGPDDALWRQDKFALKYLFTEFLKSMEEGEFPSYFIPAVNLMAGVRTYKRDQIRRQLYAIIGSIDKHVEELDVDGAQKFYHEVTGVCQRIADSLQEGNRRDSIDCS